VRKDHHIAALDGLRGCAVAAVVIYHAWPKVLPGGWIGVSIFFTLSGFLITTIVTRDHELSRASLTIFWRRRARRLLPAALATTIVTVAAVAAIDPDRLPGTAEAGIFATVYAHNWWSAATTGGYWEIFDSAPSPLAHMWSLAIEEQVYVFWPLVVLGIGLRRALVVGVAVAAVGTWFWWGNADAYYATPFRFGEVLAGAVVAAVLLQRPERRVPLVLALLAAGVIFVLSATLSEGDPFVVRGALTVLAVSAMTVVAWCATATAANRLLGAAPFTWLGQRSYAIYLFHWPLLTMLDTPPVFAVLATLVLAELSHHLIEWPIRSGARLRSPVRSLGGASVAVVAVLAIVMLSHTELGRDEIAAVTAAALAETQVATTGSPSVTVSVPESESGAEPTPEVEKMGVAETTSRTSTTMLLPKVHLSGNATVMLIGDSTAFNLRHAIAGWVEANGGMFVSKAFPTCSPVFDADQYLNWVNAFGSPEGPCRPEVGEGADLVLVVDHGTALMDHQYASTGVTYDITDAPLKDAVRRSYESTISHAARVGAQVLFVTPPRPLLREIIAHPDGFAELSSRLTVYGELLADLANDENVNVLDIGERIEDNPNRYPRSDGLHLDEATGAVHVVVDLIAPAVAFD